MGYTGQAMLGSKLRDTGLSFGTFQEDCIGIYWAGYVGVKVERHGSLFKYPRACKSKGALEAATALPVKRDFNQSPITMAINIPWASRMYTNTRV